MRPTKETAYWPVLPLISLAFLMPSRKKGDRILKKSQAAQFISKEDLIVKT